MKKLLFFTFISFNIFAASTDSISLSQEIDFACEVSFTPEPIASNLDLTTSQSHLKIFSYNVAANGLIDLNSDMPDGNKMYHNTMTSQYFAFDNMDSDQEVYNSGVLVGSSSSTGDPIQSELSQGAGISGVSWNISGNVYLNYTGVPALSLVSGTYATTWYFSCGPSTAGE